MFDDIIKCNIAGCEGREIMKSRIQILETLQRIKPELMSRYGVKWLAVFGSYARGEQEENSDVDIIVDVDPSIGLKFVELADFLESHLGVRVDVVSRRAIKARTWEVIKEELVNV